MLSLFLAAVLVAPPAAPCTAATSIHSTVAEIGSNLDRFMGKCVTVAGPFSGLAMFGGVEDMYLTSRFAPDGNYDRAAEKKGRLGLDSPKSDLRGLKFDRIRRIQVTGTVDSCERRGANARAEMERQNSRRNPAGDITIIMLTGYCHYYPGAVVTAVSWSFDPSTHYESWSGKAPGRNSAISSRWMKIGRSPGNCARLRPSSWPRFGPVTGAS